MTNVSVLDVFFVDISFLLFFPTHLSMIADAVEVVPSVQRGGVAELPEGELERGAGGRHLLEEGRPPPPLPQTVAVIEGTVLLLLCIERLVFTLHYS